MRATGDLSRLIVKSHSNPIPLRVEISFGLFQKYQINQFSDLAFDTTQNALACEKGSGLDAISGARLAIQTSLLGRTGLEIAAPIGTHGLLHLSPLRRRLEPIVHVFPKAGP